MPGAQRGAGRGHAIAREAAGPGRNQDAVSSPPPPPGPGRPYGDGAGGGRSGQRLRELRRADTLGCLSCCSAGDLVRKDTLEGKGSARRFPPPDPADYDIAPYDLQRASISR